MGRPQASLYLSLGDVRSDESTIYGRHLDNVENDEPVRGLTTTLKDVIIAMRQDSRIAIRKVIEAPRGLVALLESPQGGISLCRIAAKPGPTTPMLR